MAERATPRGSAGGEGCPTVIGPSSVAGCTAGFRPDDGVDSPSVIGVLAEELAPEDTAPSAMTTVATSSALVSRKKYLIRHPPIDGRAATQAISGRVPGRC